MQVFLDNDVHQAVDDRDVGTGPLAQPEGGVAHQVDPARVGNDEAFALQAHRPLDAGGDDGMGFRGVGARDQDTIGVLQLGDGIGHRSRAEGGGQTGHRGAVSEAGAVIDVIGAEHRPHELLHQVVFFIGHPGRAPAADLFGARAGP